MSNESCSSPSCASNYDEIKRHVLKTESWYRSATNSVIESTSTTHKKLGEKIIQLGEENGRLNLKIVDQDIKLSRSSFDMRMLKLQKERDDSKWKEETNELTKKLNKVVEEKAKLSAELISTQQILRETKDELLKQQKKALVTKPKLKRKVEQSENSFQEYEKSVQLEMQSLYQFHNESQETIKDLEEKVRGLETKNAQLLRGSEAIVKFKVTADERGAFSTNVEVLKNISANSEASKSNTVEAIAPAGNQQITGFPVASTSGTQVDNNKARGLKSHKTPIKMKNGN